jgi:hypothetical protein
MPRDATISAHRPCLRNDPRDYRGYCGCGWGCWLGLIMLELHVRVDHRLRGCGRLGGSGKGLSGWILGVVGRRRWRHGRTFGWSWRCARLAWSGDEAWLRWLFVSSLHMMVRVFGTSSLKVEHGMIVSWSSGFASYSLLTIVFRCLIGLRRVL